MTPKVSVVIPTHNRPALAKRAIASVLSQSYRELEVIVVDDGMKERADAVAASFGDARLRYVSHDKEKGGGAARNTGIAHARGDFIAFLDDDDEWMPEKLEMQMRAFAPTPPDIGFCYTAVRIAYDGGKEVVTRVPEGVGNYFEFALRNFKTFLSVTLVVKRNIFDEVGTFDPDFPSHQEADLMVRIAQKFKGLGINKPLVRVSMSQQYEHIGSNLERRIAGRELMLKKYQDVFHTRPSALAFHYFWIGLRYRDSGQHGRAQGAFLKALKARFALRYVFHYFMSVLRSATKRP